MKALLNIFLLLLPLSLAAQNSNILALWRVTLERADGNDIVFNFKLQQQNNKQVIYVINASEQLMVDSIDIKRDSVFVKMPVFESSFKAAFINNKLKGIWTKGTAGADQVMPFTAEPSNERFAAAYGRAKINVSGRWAVNFKSDQQNEPESIAEFNQNRNKLTGTFITPTGDYRYLEGIVTGNKLLLSGFDGSHAYLFSADISGNVISNGLFISGPKYKSSWTAVKNADAKVKQDVAAMHLKPGEERLNFHFPDLEGKEVSINNERFKNKVVIVQLMGSWCPNCMDETAFLSNFYNKNKDRGIEIVALAYEYSTDFKRSVQSISKFKNRFNVTYPILVTGVAVTDSLRTEKTLPQVTPIKVFPSSVIIDKKGRVRKFDTGFYGPGTGAHYEAYKKEFYKTIDELLAE